MATSRFLCSVVVIFHEYWCIINPRSSFIMLYNNSNIIAQNYILTMALMYFYIYVYSFYNTYNRYVPENLFSHDKFHADVLKYGNSHGNSASKFGGFGGNRGKKHTSVQTQQQDIPCLPLSCCRQWPENDSESLEPGDVVITIEYCHSCEEHNYKSRHNPQKYLGLAHTYREAMCKVAASYGVRLSVFLKPITIHDPYVIVFLVD